jgi:hypothetical protein
VATSFNDIFDQFLLTIDDRRFLDNLTPDIFAVTLSKYLYRAMAMFGDYCYKDLTVYTATTNDSYNFTGNGVATQFTLSSTPVINSEFYVSIDDVETEDYTYSSINNTITFSSTPTLDSEIYVGTYLIGSITADLNIQEISILARAMTIPWLEFMLLKKKHLDQIVYGKNMQVHSQANHTKENRETLETIRKKIEQDMYYYTYKQNDDELDGINGSTY